MSPLEVNRFHTPYSQLDQPFQYISNLFSQFWMYLFLIAIAMTLYLLQPKRVTLMNGG